jgi:hypothetical protein
MLSSISSKGGGNPLVVSVRKKYDLDIDYIWGVFFRCTGLTVENLLPLLQMIPSIYSSTAQTR